MQPQIQRLLSRLQPADRVCWLYGDAQELQAALDACARAAARAHAPFHSLPAEAGEEALCAQVLEQLDRAPGAWIAADLTAAASLPADRYAAWLEGAWAQAAARSTRLVGLYDACRLAPEAVLGILERHSLVIHGQEPLFIDAGDLLPLHRDGERDLAAQLERFLSWLKRSSRVRCQLERQVEELATFQAIARAVTLSLALDEMLPAALQQVVSLIQADLGCIYLGAPHGRRLYSHALQGTAPDLTRPLANRDRMDQIERWVEEQGRPILIDDVRSSPLGALWPPQEHTARCPSLLLAPLRSHGQMHGLIALGTHSPGQLGAEEAAILASLTELLGVALDNARLYAQTQQRAEEMSSLYDLSLAATSLDPQAILQLIAERIMRLFGATCFFVALIDQESGQIHFAHIVDDGELLPPFTLPLAEEGGLTRYVLATGQPLLIADLAAEAERLPVPPIHSGQAARSWLGVPLVAKGRTIGVMSVQSYALAAFDEDDQRLLSLAAQQAASALENARLFQATRALERRYHALLEELDDGYAVLQDERLVFANTRLARMLGSSAAVQTSSLVQLLASDDGRCWELLTAPDAPDREPVHYRTRLPRSDGFELEVEVTVSRIEYEGRPALALLCRDITSQARLEAQLMQAEKLSAVGQLVSGVAHELNNPLTTIKGYAQLLQGEVLSPGAVDDLRRIEEAADRCRRIVRDLLTFARRYDPEVIDTDVNELLQRTVALRSYELRVHDIGICWDLEPHLPSIQADPHRLQQVILNLVFNAEQALRDAGQGGQITIRSRLAPGGDDVRFEVIDNGPGIRPEHTDRIFDPFFTTKEVGMGTGLGLAISYGIVKEHGGRIWAQSRPGIGATFVVELPIASSSPPTATGSRAAE